MSRGLELGGVRAFRFDALLEHGEPEVAICAYHPLMVPTQLGRVP